MRTESFQTLSRTDSGTSDGARVSVVIPAFNAAKYLSATLQSTREQVLRPDEVIVVDDGSTDRTKEIAAAFGATVISLTNAGPSAARNAGTRAARGKYIAFLDADDLWDPNKSGLQLAAIEAYGRPAFSFTDFRAFDENGFHQRTSELRYHWAFRKNARKTKGRTELFIATRGDRPVMYDDNYIQPSTVLVRRADVLAIGGFDETLRASEDYEFFLRLFKILPAIVLMQPLLFYRRHPGQATANGTVMKSSFFEVAQRIAASPDRYPAGDVRYIARTEYLREYRLGVEQSRLGQFDAAAQSFGRSLAARASVAARVGLVAAQVCRGALGRGIFRTARAVWKRRPGRP